MELEPTTDCAELTIHRGTIEVALLKHFGFQYTNNYCAGGACASYRYTLTVKNAATGQVLHSDQFTIASPSGIDGSWTCTYDGWARTCRKSVAPVIDVSGFTQTGDALLRMEASAEQIGFGEDATLEGVADLLAGPALEEISFNYEPPSDQDGLTLAIDSTTPVVAPEWKRATKETPPASAPYTESTSAPAAFLAPNRLKLKAKFYWPLDSDTTVTIKGLPQVSGAATSPFGDLAPQTLTFDPNGYAEAVFVSDLSGNKVLANDVSIRWSVISVKLWDLDHTENWLAAIGPYSNRRTEHRIYTVLRPPVATMAVPWAKVLELSSGILAEVPAAATESVVHRRLVEGLVGSMWTGFVTRFFDARARYEYDPGATHTLFSQNGSQQNPRLTQILTKLEDLSGVLPMQCADNANLHAVLAASQGFAFQPLFMRHATPGLKLARTAIYKPIGSSQQGCWQHEFNFHQVPQIQGLLYDASAQRATGTLENCQATGYFWGDTLATYLPSVFPGPPPQELTSTYQTPATVVGLDYIRDRR